jgi:hypothetical protein
VLQHTPWIVVQLDALYYCISGFGFLSWQRLTSCAFKPVCHHIWHRFGFQEPSVMSSSCFSAPVYHLLPSCIAPLCFYLSVCLSPYKTTIGLMIFSPSWNITNIQSTNARNWTLPGYWWLFLKF